MTLRKTLLAASVGAALTGCVSLTPEMPVAEPNIPAHWNDQAQKKETRVEGKVIASWDEVIEDEHLRDLIHIALENNRDIRSSLLDIKKIKERYRIQEAGRSVQVNGSADFQRGRNGQASVSESWQAVGSVSYELDLFKRAEALSEAAWKTYLEQAYHHEAAKVSLVAEVTATYLDFLASQRKYQLALDTWESREASYALSEERNELGQVSSLSLAQERGLVEAASREVAMHGGSIIKSRQSLETLVGASLEDMLLDSQWGEVVQNHPAVTSDLPSTALLMRPDIQASEASLAAANAQVGAARAALFPSLRLTGQLGTISNEFSSLMGSGTSLWGLSPSLHMPIFDGGRLAAQEKIASIEQQQALLGYERQLRLAFQEVADILTDMSSLKRQHAAQKGTVKAAEEAYRLSKARYDAGRDDYLALLDAERTLYAAQKDLITLDLARQKAQIALYKALGGGVAPVSI